MGGDARDLQRAAEPGEEGAEKQRAGEQHRLVDAERRHHVAILRRGAHQDAETRPAQQKPDEPEHHGARRRSARVHRTGKRRPRISTGARRPGARGPENVLAARTPGSTRSCTTSTTPKVASSWNSSGAR